MSFSGKGTTCTICPYYSLESDLTITCEGIVEETENALKFASREAKVLFQEDTCFFYPNSCPIANILDERYKQ